MYAPILSLTSLTVLMGLAPESVFVLVVDAADQLFQRAAYVRAVLGVDLDESLAY